MAENPTSTRLCGPLCAVPPQDAAGVEAVVLHVRACQEIIAIDVRGEECLADLRQTLAEVAPSCFVTNYTLHYNGTPLTQDSAPLSQLIPELGRTPCPPLIEMVSDRYNYRTLRQHIFRTRGILQHPDVPILSPSGIRVPKVPPEQIDNATPRDILQDLLDIKSLPSDSSPGMTDAEPSLRPVVALAGTVLERSLSVAVNGLPELDARVFRPGFRSLPRKPQCIQFLRSSQDNPPPRWRRLQGEIWDIDIGTLEGTTYRVTGTERGFVLHKANRRNCKPKKYWGTLHELLRDISKKYVAGVGSLALDVGSAGAALPYKLMQPESPNVAWIIDEDESGDVPEEILERPLGLAPWDMPRDWNAEFQNAREALWTDDEMDEDDRLVKEKAFLKTVGDFRIAAMLAAVHVREGTVKALPPQDAAAYRQTFLPLGCPNTRPLYTWQNLVAIQEMEADDEIARRKFLTEYRSSDMLTAVNAGPTATRKVCSLVTSVIDYGGARILVRASPPVVARDAIASPTEESTDGARQAISQIDLGHYASQLRVVPGTDGRQYVEHVRRGRHRY